jgi:hypothetical protein
VAIKDVLGMLVIDSLFEGRGEVVGVFRGVVGVAIDWVDLVSINAETDLRRQ